MAEKKRVLFVQAYDRASPESFLSVPLGIHRVGFHVEANVPEAECHFFDPNLYHKPEGDLQRIPDFMDTSGDGFTKAREIFEKGMDGKGKYDVIAFSPLHFTLEYDIANMLAAEQISPHSLMVAGGQQAAFADKQLYGNWPALDAVVLGEGEKPFAEIMKRVVGHGVSDIKRNPALLHEVKGLFLRDPSSNGELRTIRTGHNPAMSNDEFLEATKRLDFGPRMRSKDYWAWIEANYTDEQLKDPNLLRKIRVVKPYTTNYCPMDCSFCSTTNFYRDAGDGTAKVRGLRGEHLGEYLRDILNTNADAMTVYFKDDLWFIRGSGGCPAAETDFVRELQEELGKEMPNHTRDLQLLADLDVLHQIRTDPDYEERGISYFGKARVDTFINPKTMEVNEFLLRATKKAGFNAISFGVESFDIAELDHFNKRLGKNGPAVNRKAMEICQQAGIHAIAYMILSCDISTPDSIMTSVEEAASLVADGHTIKINPWLYSLPGTKLAYMNEQSRASVLKSEYEVPGHPDKKIERVIKIFPTDQGAMDLMCTFEDELPEFKDRMKQQLGITHWISEIGTPTQLLLLCETAKRAGMQPTNTNTGEKVDLEGTIELLKNTIKNSTGKQAEIVTYA